MAESKNTFLKGRMNKDLDNRLLGEGEYRDALNISVGKSENNTVGSLQNVLGNERVPIPIRRVDPSMKCIGAYMDNNNNRIFQFLTNYTDPNPEEITIPTTGKMQITVYDFDTQTYTILVSGLFLNLATNPEFTITGINLLENLLFWTDNRNQPRKININNALQNPSNSSTPYYTNETQISVAKYAPVEPITLYRKVITKMIIGRTSSTTINVEDATGIVPGMTLITSEVSSADFCIVKYVTTNPLPAPQTVTFYEDVPSSVVVGTELTFLISTMTNKSDDPNWPGDSAFLEDKYVRFSYRFKYDDNEYSLMAPFTQITYIPKQKGYFIAGDESAAFRSTVLNWFENNVNNIELLIPLPDSGNKILNSYKIIELDILYKESDSNAVKVFETITVQTISQKSLDNNVYIQQYQSQKPYKTLPEQETTRVYDKVPVRARAQESISNRIVYGNYYDKYTPPRSIDYYVTVQPKSNIYTNFIEYPNHTVKQNRNYQVGFILSDKFGRQSPVLLSQVDLEGITIGGTTFGGSTIYSPYTGINNIEFPGVKQWFGNALLLIVNSPIASDRDIPNGTPGLYATVSGIIPNSTKGFEIISGTVDNDPIKYTYTFGYTLQPSGDAQLNYPKEGNYLRGKYTDYVRIIDASQGYLETDGPINDIYNYNPANIPDVKYSYDINPIGWYSYKVVVRQQEQDYYNVYLPGMLNGYPVLQTYGTQVNYSTSTTVANPILENGINTSDFPVGETDKTAHIVLTNDNINKVPRDLVEVGPDQKQYRSSVQLYGRVTNTAETDIIIEGIVDAPNYKYIGNSFTYDVTSNPQYALVGPGNGIQSYGANKDIPGTPPTANPDRWYGNTVVVSNTIVGSTGTIVFSPPNVLDARDEDYRTFNIVRAENIQYYPTKKADVVSSIATATDFSFLDNSVENITGKAALNLYQLQTNPLIGRVNTVMPIGVESADMTPFLSVYETKPDYSLLDLFWETSTTGLISDLNTDINTGYEGPTGFTFIDYVHYEFQDQNGDGQVEGDANSKYVTNSFYPKNAAGISLTNTEITFISITDNTARYRNRINDFKLEKQIIGTEIGSWRICIDNAFVFNYNAISLESYTFTVNVLDNDTGISNTLTITGRLRNNEPEFIDFPDFVNITQATTTIHTFSGVNGSFSNAISGLQYRIMSGDTVPSSFSLNPVTGELILTRPSITLGTYNLTIRLTDAVNFAQNPPLGTITTGSPSYFGSLYTENVVAINVGSNPVPYWIRPDYLTTGRGLYNATGAGGLDDWCPINTPTAYPYKYGIGYIGKRNITLNNEGFNANLPIAPGSEGKYQFAENIEVVNGLNHSPPVTVIPEGLTQGTVKWTIEIAADKPFNPDNEPFFNDNQGDVIIYYREQDALPTAPWQIVSDDNNVFYITWQDGVGGELEANASSANPTPPYQSIVRYTSFTTTNPNVGITGEWAIAVRLFSDMDGCYDSYLKIRTEDANFTYSSLDYNTPIVTSHAYQTGIQLDYFGTTISGIPWDDQDARRGIAYTSPVNKITVVDIISPTVLNVTLDTFNPQIVIGLRIKNSGGATFVSDVIATNVDGNPNKIAIIKDPFNPINAGRDCIFTDRGNLNTRGTLYATTDLATHVKKFYINSGLTQEWNPPVANKFYNFWQPAKSYNTPGTSGPSKKPFFCAKINANGEVIELAAPANTVQTAWQRTGSAAYINYGRNIINGWG